MGLVNEANGHIEAILSGLSTGLRSHYDKVISLNGEIMNAYQIHVKKSQEKGVQPKFQPYNFGAFLLQGYVRLLTSTIERMKIGYEFLGKRYGIKD